MGLKKGRTEAAASVLLGFGGGGRGGVEGLSLRVHLKGSRSGIYSGLVCFGGV